MRRRDFLPGLAVSIASARIAKALGLDVPDKLQQLADEVIE